MKSNKDWLTMPVDEFQEFIDRLKLVDSAGAARLMGVRQSSLRNPKGRYKKLAVKIGQYWFWRTADLKSLGGDMFCEKCGYACENLAETRRGIGLGPLLHVCNDCSREINEFEQQQENYAKQAKAEEDKYHQSQNQLYAKRGKQEN